VLVCGKYLGTVVTYQRGNKKKFILFYFLKKEALRNGCGLVGSSGGLLLLEWETGIGSCFGKKVFQDVIAIALDKRAMVRSYMRGLEESYIGSASLL